MTDIDWSGALARAEANAPFLAMEITRMPDLAALLAAGEGEAALAWARQAGAGAPDLGAALRREKRGVALTLAIGDLAGAFALPRVCAELTDMADRALDAAIIHAIHERTPEASPQGFVALALGKQGARELNFSSDIDPILLFDPQTLPRRQRDDPGEAAQHVARTLMQTMSQVTAEGYVFRVDLRLRPASEISPLAISLGAALTHYESQALTWERSAFIRARAAAGDVAMGARFLAEIRSFVWRRSLDFGAITEIGRLTRRIRATHGKVAVPGPGFDLKRGPGGIREIEFFAQAHQLIHGGRNPALRVSGTGASLDALATAEIISADDARRLGESYDRLRTIEHRLQMVGDRQNHALPENPAALDAVARLDGLDDGAALVAELAAITQYVRGRYDQLITVSPGAQSTQPAALEKGLGLEAELARLGFDEPDALAARIDGWRGGTLRCLRSDAAIAAYDAIQPALLAELARAPDPVRAITRWEQMLDLLPSALNMFRLLEARPALLPVLVRVLALAPPLADELARRAVLLDALIDASAFALPGDVPALVAALTCGEQGEDYERLLDRVRRRVGELRFALGVQLIEGTSDTLAISAALARVAEATIEVLASAASTAFEAAHGVVPGADGAKAELVVVALGRLAGGQLTPASDLDLVYLFTGDFAAQSTGERPMGATRYFNRLAQQVSAALSVPTAAGALYQVDTRLRPHGLEGALAVSLTSFTQYQREQAWTWEHMALARARVVCGSPAAREAVAAAIASVLAVKRDPVKLRADLLAMHARVVQHKPPSGPLDAKLQRGGLVDFEFLLQYVQLREGRAFNPDLSLALAELVVPGHLPASLTAHFAFLSRLLMATRLLAPDGQVPPPASLDALVSACGCDDWDALTSQLAAARHEIGVGWATVLGEPLPAV